MVKLFSKISIIVLIFGITTLASEGDPNAITIFDNGSPDFYNGFEVTVAIEADDFELQRNYYVTGAVFWTVEGYGADRGGHPWDGTLEYFVFDTNPNNPSEPCHSPFVRDYRENIVKTYSLDQAFGHYFVHDIGGNMFWITHKRELAFHLEGNPGTPIPEPSTLLLFGVGIIGVVAPKNLKKLFHLSSKHWW